MCIDLKTGQVGLGNRQHGVGTRNKQPNQNQERLLCDCRAADAVAADPAARALKHRCYIVSCNWRNNSTIFEPTGKIVSQIRPPKRVLAQEIDLSYRILPWSRQLKNGAALKEKYGDKVGFRYYEDEDCGLFWSNDSRTTIDEMAKSIKMVDWSEEHARLEKLFLEVQRNQRTKPGP